MIPLWSKALWPILDWRPLPISAGTGRHSEPFRNLSKFFEFWTLSKNFEFWNFSNYWYFRICQKFLNFEIYQNCELWIVKIFCIWKFRIYPNLLNFEIYQQFGNFEICEPFFAFRNFFLVLEFIQICWFF